MTLAASTDSVGVGNPRSNMLFEILPQSVLLEKIENESNCLGFLIGRLRTERAKEQQARKRGGEEALGPLSKQLQALGSRCCRKAKPDPITPLPSILPAPRHRADANLERTG